MSLREQRNQVLGARLLRKTLPPAHTRVVVRVSAPLYKDKLGISPGQGT